MKEYLVRENVPEKTREDLKEYPELLQKLLYYRGVENSEIADKFLNPDYEKHLHDAFLMKDMDKAVERILRAIHNNERILVYSDYDADGIPAAVIMHDFFNLVGFSNFEVYIPHRHNEGFGLHLEAIDTFKDRIKLMITLDCGIADVTEVDHANTNGIDVIITDHHLPGEVLPKAYAILNAKQKDCEYPYKMLCGAGVAYKLIQALIASKKFEIKDGKEKWLLDMAGLATLSDMVPLDGENRVLAHYGLKVLRKSPRPGLQKLLAKLRIDQRTMNEDDLGFMIVPRINAASRMGVPMDAFHLLSSKDVAVAGAHAEHLDKINTERKSMVGVMVKEIKKHIEERKERLGSVIVIGNPNWRPALLGLAANSLVEEYNRPVFLWGRENGNGIKGSCRTDGSVDLVKLMQSVSHLFSEFGGHSASGGFAVEQDKIHTIEEEIVNAYEKVKKIKEEQKFFADAEISIDDVNVKNFELVDRLAPFGVGNPKPIFILKNIIPTEIKVFGKAKDHTELTFHNSKNYKVKAICFFKKPEDFEIKLGKNMPINLIASMEKSYFGNKAELRLRIIDII